MKTLVKNNCTGCHTLSYILQHRFEEDGWYKVLDLMKNVNVSGVNVAHERKANARHRTQSEGRSPPIWRAPAARAKPR